MARYFKNTENEQIVQFKDELEKYYNDFNTFHLSEGEELDENIDGKIYLSNCEIKAELKAAFVAEMQLKVDYEIDGDGDFVLLTDEAINLAKVIINLNSNDGDEYVTDKEVWHINDNGILKKVLLSTLGDAEEQGVTNWDGHNWVRTVLDSEYGYNNWQEISKEDAELLDNKVEIDSTKWERGIRSTYYYAKENDGSIIFINDNETQFQGSNDFYEFIRLGEGETNEIELLDLLEGQELHEVKSDDDDTNTIYSAIIDDVIYIAYEKMVEGNYQTVSILGIFNNEAEMLDCAKERYEEITTLDL